MISYFPVVTGSLTVSGSVNISGGITASGGISISGSIASASFASTASFVALAQSASNAVSAQTASFANTLTVAGNLTAQTLVVQTITSSVDFVTGSTRFGSLLDNTHVFSGSVTMNPNGLFVSSSGVVGIGTTSPNEILEVFGSEVAGTSQQTRIRIAQAASVSSRVNLVSGVISGSNPYFAIEARQGSSPFAIVERLRIDGSGNVGIGITSPTTLLHINGSSATLTIADSASYAAGVGGKLSLHGNYRSVGDITEGGYIKASKTNSSNGDYGFDMVFATSNYTAGVAERMRITSTGNIGIGTSSPNTFLHISGSNTSNRGQLSIQSNNSSNAAKATWYYDTFNSGEIGTTSSDFYALATNSFLFYAGGNPRMTITSNGNILINQPSALTGVTTSVEMSGVGSSTPTLQASYNVYANHGAANTTWRGYNVFHKSRGTTAGSVTAVAADDFLGTIRWNGADGTGFVIGAEITAIVDGTTGTNDMPTRLIFSTTADGGSSPTERMRITNSGQVRVIGVGNTLAFDTDGSGASTTLGTNGQYDFRIYNARGGASNIDVSTYDIGFGTNGSTNRYRMGTNSFIPSADNSYSCGASGQRWSAIWAANGTIQTSDQRQKKDIIDSNLGLEFINKLRPVSYKWKVGKNVVTVDGERIDENGARHSNDIITPVEGTRTHYGLIAQEVKEVLGDIDFGGYIHDEETDTLALRYDQFISPLIKAIQELNTKFEEYKATHP